MKKVIFTVAADLHLKAAEPLGVASGGIYRNTRTEEKLRMLDFFLAESVKREASFAVLAGDIFETASPPKWLSHLFSKVIRKYKDRIGIYYVPGNHDSAGGIDALISEGELSGEGFFVTSDIESADILGSKFVFCPYYQIDMLGLFDDPPPEEIDILFTHCYLRGADVCKSNRSLRIKGEGLDVRELPGKYIIAGDIHKYQVLKNRAIYPGPLARVDISDSETNPGFITCTYDGNELTYKHVKLPDISIYKGEVSEDTFKIDDLDNEDTIDEMIDGAFGCDIVRITFKGGREWLREIPFKDIRKSLKESGARKVFLPTDVISDEEIETLIDEEAALDVSSSIITRWTGYAKQIDMDEAVASEGIKQLKDVYRDSLSEAGDPYHIEHVAVRNIARFSDSEVDFEGPDSLTMVLGKNLDLVGSGSNGCGKTALFDAISWAIIGTIPGKGRVIETIDAKGYFSDVLLQSGSDTLRIKRGMRGGKKYLDVWKNGDAIRATRMKEAQDFICRELSLPPMDADGVSAYFNVGYLSYTFFSAFAGHDTDSAERIRLISKYLSLDPIDDVMENIRKYKNKELNPKIDKLSGGLESLKEQRGNLGDCSSISNLLPGEPTEALDTLKQMKKKATDSLRRSEERLVKLRKDAQGVSEYYRLVIQVRNAEQERDKLLEPLRRGYDSLRDEIDTLDDLHSEMDTLKEEIDNFPDWREKIETLRSKTREANDKMSDLESERRSAKKDIGEKRATMEKGLVCPECSTELMYVDGKLSYVDMSVLRKEIDKLESLVQDIDVSIEKYRNEEASFSKKLEEAIDGKTKLESMKDRFNSLSRTITSIEEKTPELDGINEKGKKIKKEFDEKIDSINAEIEKLTVPDAQADKDIMQREIDDLENKIDKYKRAQSEVDILEAKVLDYRDSRDKLDMKITEQDKLLRKVREELHIILSLVDEFPRFRILQIRQAAPVIEMYTNQNIEDLNSELRMRLHFDERGKKQLTQQLVIYITDEEGIERPLSTFSSGERERISLAATIALKRFAQEMGGFRVGWCKMDEVWEGLDHEGQEALINFLHNRKGQYLIISHGEISTRVENAIYVIREGGVSSFSLD